MNTFDWVTQLLYVSSAVCFVLGLHLMNSPASARRGNQVSTAGMALAIATTFALVVHAGTITATGWAVMIAGTLVGALLIGVTAHNAVGYVLAFVAAAFAAMNVVGGYVVTGRMLKMFRRTRTPVPAADTPAAVNGRSNGGRARSRPPRRRTGAG